MVLLNCCGISLLELNGNELHLQDDHSYYYQIQMQLALTQEQKCYLVVWSPKNMIYTCVYFNDNFWTQESAKAQQFFYKCVLPEVLAAETDWDVSTSENVSLFEEAITEPSTSKATSIDAVLYRICQEEDDQKTPMIACESGVCSIEWYHLACVGLESVPDGVWICDRCKK
ncbi:hypothetical protein TcasGA2_TC031978 [Tribolium castaneum]|uniref:PHD-type domain-containing protein n=1 Tax=Tribolium castaneum TaxID=7070 RepID=A0A139WNP3_TRICA|nr:hypothetical protein TcasGA2_TC031978 [Tribolium castaneum]